MKSGLRGLFYGQLFTEYVDGNMWRLRQMDGCRFGIAVEGIGTIEPPDGFFFDFASVPPPASWIFPKPGDGPHGAYGPAAVIHDWLYSFPGKITREQADRIFLLGMEIKNVAAPMRSLFYMAVRIGGKKYFGNPDKLNKMRKNS